MPERVTLSQLAKRFGRAPLLIHAEVEKSMTVAAILVRDTAVKKFGTYQSATGEFPAWEPLKPATVTQKAKAGTSGDDPLIGHYSGSRKNKVWPAPLRNTISIKVEGWVAAVGTDDPLGKYHEYGTEDIPPRPYLRPSLYEQMAEIQAIMAGGLAAGLRKM